MVYHNKKERKWGSSIENLHIKSFVLSLYLLRKALVGFILLLLILAQLAMYIQTIVLL